MFFIEIKRNGIVLNDGKALRNKSQFLQHLKHYNTSKREAERVKNVSFSYIKELERDLNFLKKRRDYGDDYTCKSENIKALFELVSACESIMFTNETDTEIMNIEGNFNNAVKIADFNE